MGTKEYCADLSTSHILYLDCNSLYATCQQFPLPIGDFRLLSDDELARFDMSSVAADSPIGYIVECDLKYPTHLHDLHNAYMLAPEHLCIDEDMLSDMHKFMLDMTECRRLKYETRLESARLSARQVALRHALQVPTVLPRSRTGLDVNPLRRGFHIMPIYAAICRLLQRAEKNAKSEFESNLYKLLANSFYGKTCENVHRRCNVRLIADEKKFVRAIAKANYKHSQIINDDLAIV